MAQNQCAEIINLLSEYLSNELSMDDAGGVREHLANCPPCEEFYESLQDVVQRTHQLKRTDIPPEVAVRLKAYLQGKITP